MRSLPFTVQNEVPPSPDRVDNLVLSIGTAKSVAVPTGARFGVFSATGTFYARWDGSAAVVPTADVTDGTGAEINPTVRDVRDSASVSLIASAACVVAVAWYS
jgi:hypothetical protein